MVTVELFKMDVIYFSNIRRITFWVVNGGTVCSFILKAMWVVQFLASLIGPCRGRDGFTQKVGKVSKVLRALP